MFASLKGGDPKCSELKCCIELKCWVKKRQIPNKNGGDGGGREAQVCRFLEENNPWKMGNNDDDDWYMGSLPLLFSLPLASPQHHHHHLWCATWERRVSFISSLAKFFNCKIKAKLNRNYVMKNWQVKNFLFRLNLQVWTWHCLDWQIFHLS